jgi:hypothetical protein
MKSGLGEVAVEISTVHDSDNFKRLILDFDADSIIANANSISTGISRHRVNIGDRL